MNAADLTLEDRVSVLEREFANLRDRELPDLKAQIRGWAEIAVRADHKAGAAGELLTLIHQDVREIKEEVQEHTAKLDRHGEVLDRHTATLDSHTAMLREILARLPEQAGRPGSPASSR